jgi:hypothetical protein
MSKAVSTIGNQRNKLCSTSNNDQAEFIAEVTDGSPPPAYFGMNVADDG